MRRHVDNHTSSRLAMPPAPNIVLERGCRCFQYRTATAHSGGYYTTTATTATFDGAYAFGNDIEGVRPTARHSSTAISGYVTVEHTRSPRPAPLLCPRPVGRHSPSGWPNLRAHFRRSDQFHWPRRLAATPTATGTVRTTRCVQSRIAAATSSATTLPSKTPPRHQCR